MFRQAVEFLGESAQFGGLVAMAHDTGEQQQERLVFGV
jgi:hypothetical protein